MSEQPSAPMKELIEKLSLGWPKGIHLTDAQCHLLAEFVETQTKALHEARAEQERLQQELQRREDQLRVIAPKGGRFIGVSWVCVACGANLSDGPGHSETCVTRTL